MPICDIFCRVIDNFGDAGIAVRLACGLASEHGFHVRLYIDDLAPLEKLAPQGLGPQVDVLPLSQREREGPVLQSATREAGWEGEGEKPADLVIELLGAEIPDDYIAEMQTRPGGPPVWVRYEYLSAEDWVDGAHLKPSPHPRSGLSRTFFYPGLTPQTGGLLFSDTLGVAPPKTSNSPSRIMMFTYDHPGAQFLADLWAGSNTPMTLDVSHGAYLQHPPASNGALTVNTIPFLPQGDFDRRIGTYDLAFIRGEDSFTQAVAAGVPVIWQIYPTEDHAHLVKLQAFCDRFTDRLSPGAATAFTDMQMVWNGGAVRHPRPRIRALRGPKVDFRGDPATINEFWTDFTAHFPEISARAREFGAEIRAHGSALQNMVDFWRQMG